MSASGQRGRPMLRAGLAVALAGLGAAGVWLWWNGASSADPIRIEVANADLGRGAALYAEHCASCHGADLEDCFKPPWATVTRAVVSSTFTQTTPGPGNRAAGVQNTASAT